MSATSQLTPYELLGGEAVLRQLVDRFYDEMELDPKANSIRRMHAPNLGAAREKLFMFLSGWLGGPNLFVEKYGHPMLRARHLPFAIGEAERDQWVYCMLKAMQTIPMADELRTHLEQAFWRTADFMRNKDETQGLGQVSEREAV